MPELPEVETIRRQLAPLVEGRVVERLEIADPRWCLPLAPAAIVDAVQGRTVQRLARRGKYLVWALEDEAFLLMHLRMTGTLLYDAPPGTPYERVRWTLDDGHELRFCDPRRFGTGELALGTPARDAFFAARLGLEPLDGELTGEALRRMARGRRAPVKAFLLDQRRIAGVGNIYADEALWRARVHPLRPAGELGEDELRALHRGIRAALKAAIARQGATLRDYRMPDGGSGRMQHEFKVYGREGEPCERCGRPIEKIRAGGRGTWFCPSCQPFDGTTST